MSEINDWLRLGRELLDVVEKHYGESKAVFVPGNPAFTGNLGQYFADQRGKEPCKHEPREEGVGDFQFTVAECKHCKCRLKATGWVEA